MKNKTTSSLGITAGILALSVMITVLGTQANAECFATSDQWLALAKSAKNTLPLTQLKVTAVPAAKAAQGDEDSDGNSIVGLWHVHYLGPFPGGDQEAFQIFNAGGTEVHNPNSDPRGGTLCLGAWAQTGRNSYKLTHRVWLYDPAGGFHGLGHLEVNINVTDKGAKQSGTLTFQVFDLDGNPVSPVFPGTLAGERISPN